ncbi:hypothetical protein EDB81DRAFT_761733 [Dactylonectria macrodidyma]|uniref:Uncharacterized protein n=1 Tax=Dactylonectria macrodidyma TaxID=307937 RepID=A0A9P9EG94_9HYPO|nr:hypothetical protein EDB81DRAFT_761733 [Dactylonectria macrodidyma]
MNHALSYKLREHEYKLSKLKSCSGLPYNPSVNEVTKTKIRLRCYSAVMPQSSHRRNHYPFDRLISSALAPYFRATDGIKSHVRFPAAQNRGGGQRSGSRHRTGHRPHNSGEIDFAKPWESPKPSSAAHHRGPVAVDVPQKLGFEIEDLGGQLLKAPRKILLTDSALHLWTSRNAQSPSTLHYGNAKITVSIRFIDNWTVNMSTDTTASDEGVSPAPLEYVWLLLLGAEFIIALTFSLPWYLLWRLERERVGVHQDDLEDARRPFSVENLDHADPARPYNKWKTEMKDAGGVH